MLEFLFEHKDTILIVSIGLIGLFSMGKKKAVSILLTVIDEFKSTVFANIEEEKEKHVQFVFEKLPKRAKVFITKKRISAILDDFLETAKK